MSINIVKIKNENEKISLIKDSVNKIEKARVNWEGSQFYNSSLAHVNREITKKLIEQEIFEIGIIPYEEDSNFQLDSQLFEIKKKYVEKGTWSNISVRHQWPPNFTAPNSGVWILMQPWEFGSIPKNWYIPMKYWIDQIWVYSNYNKENYIRAGIPESKVKVIPLGIDENIFNTSILPIPLKTKKSFKFLFVGGTIYRKGIDTLLQAYLEEFTNQDNVCLVIKDFGSNSFYKGQTFGEKIKEIQSNPNNPEILYIDDVLSVSEISGLYRATDCLVHPYRGEGFGLPIIEAMACGVPVIVPSIGPSVDFCNENNAFFVNCEEEKLSEMKIGDLETIDYPWLLKLDKFHLRAQMRSAFEQRELTKLKGLNASKDILSNFTWKHTVDIINENFKQLLQLEQISRLTKEKIIEIETLYGEKLYQTNNLFESYQVFNTLLHSYPDDLDTLYNAAITVYNLDKTKTLHYLLKITELMEGRSARFQAEVWNFIGLCYMDLEDYSNSLASFEKGISIDPEYEIIIENLEYITQRINSEQLNIRFNLVDLNNISEEEYNEEFLKEKTQYEKNPNSIRTLYKLGLLLMIKRDYTNAVHLFKQGIQCFDKRVYPVEILSDFYKYLGICYFEMKNLFKAKETLQTALKLNDCIEIKAKLNEVKDAIISIKRYCSTKKNMNIATNDLINKSIEENDNFINGFSIEFSKYFCSNQKVLYIGEPSQNLRLSLNQMRIKLEVLDLDKFNIKNYKLCHSNYDGVIFDTVYQNCSNDDFMNLVQAVLHRLNKHGKIILISPESSFSVENSESIGETDLRSFSKTSIKRYLEYLGITIKESVLLNGDIYYIVAQKNTIEMSWESPVFNSSGYAEEQKDFLTALRPFPIKVNLKPKEDQPKLDLLNFETRTYLTNLKNNQNKYPIVHYQAGPAYQFALPSAPISIGRTMFETDSVPFDWIPKLNELTEIWVPSEFNRQTFASAGVNKDKIYIVPEAINEEKYQLEKIKPFFIQANKFKFLSIFDWSVRKGWDILVRAYIEEFEEFEDVSLVLKVNKALNPNANPRKDILELAKKLGKAKIPHISLIENYIKEEEILQLYAVADAFVLPSRGEGWGRPYMDAMAMGLPTIGTKWSGQLQFMNDSNSYLINTEAVVPVDQSMPAFYHGHKWAQPSVEHLKKIMREIFENSEQAKSKGKFARNDLFYRFSRQKIGNRINQRINYLLDKHLNS